MTHPHEPAFIQNGITKGLTKREYFAAMALQGLLAKYGTDYESACVKDSVGIADALIKALNND